MDDPFEVIAFDAEANIAYRADGVSGVITNLLDDQNEETDDWYAAIKAVVSWPDGKWGAFAFHRLTETYH